MARHVGAHLNPGEMWILSTHWSYFTFCTFTWVQTLNTFGTFASMLRLTQESLSPLSTRSGPREMKPCDSAARRRGAMRAPRETPSSARPGTSCQWSLGATTLTRADSRASKRFTPQKVTLKMWCLQPAGGCVVCFFVVFFFQLQRATCRLEV